MDINKVSIIIPTYKRPILLRETLVSVKNQSYTNWECIVVDDDNQKSGKLIVDQFSEKDNRFLYYSRPKNIAKGVSNCRNYGFEKSTGIYIQWIDDDDLLSSNKLEKQVATLNAHRDENVFVTSEWDHYWPGKKYTPHRLLDSESINPKKFFPLLTEKLSFIPLHCYLTPRKLAIKAGPWNNDLFINEDAEYFTRILMESERLYHVGGCNVLYRTHGLERISNRMSTRAVESLIKSLELIYQTLHRKNIHCNAYFKWKLLKLVLNNWKKYNSIFKKHSKFLKRIGINLKYIRYLQFRYMVYKQVMPILKKLR